MFIEFHLIQNFAPSNLNRDDTNNPKDCEFGGVRRARISSQCIKRACREHLVFETTTAVETGSRTRWLARHLAEVLVEADKPQDEADKVAMAFTDQYLGGMDKKEKQRSKVLIYISTEERQTIVDTLLEDWKSTLTEVEQKAPFDKMVKDLIKTTQNRTSAPDIALFGRMLADEPKLNLEAACQVAHAISTHRVSMEMDFFTAVDDLQQEEETGAGMMGVTGFNSACFYRYARIDWEQLVKNLDKDVPLGRRAVEGFLRANVLSVPSGKQNSFAAQNLPAFLLAVVRQDGQSWSLANAFETPVYPGKDGLVNASIAAFDGYWGKLQRVYGNGQMQATALSLNPDASLPHLQDTLVENLDACVEAVLTALPQE